MRTARAALIAVLACGCGDESAAPARPDDTMKAGERASLPGRIAFVSERDGQAEVYLADPRTGAVRRLTESESADYPATVAPDSRSVLVVSSSGEGQRQAERMARVWMDGSPARSIGPVSARVRSPSWSPDGTWLVFESDTASFRDLYRMDADGANLRRLTDDAAGNFDPAVSPDGRWIAFVSSRDGDAEVYVMPADGSSPRRVTAFHRDDWSPRWSPDARTIAFLSNRDGRDRVYLVRADGTALRPLSADTSFTQQADPAWSPDGSQVALTVRLPDGGTRIAVVDARSGASRVVSPLGESAAAPSWSPDGRHLAYAATSATGDADIRIVRADAGAVVTVATSSAPDWLPRWFR